MGREKEGFRENLALLNERYPEHDLLTIEEVTQVTGFRSRKTVLKHLGSYVVGGRRISKVHVARWMCG